MAFLPAIPLIGKALTALKSGSVAAGAAKAGMGAYKGLKAAGLPKGIARFAGDKVMKAGRAMSPEGFAKNLGMPMSRDEKLMMVAPDLLFGGIAAATTEGDIVDKAIAGAGSAAGGIAGGIGLRGVLGPTNPLGQLGTEMIGGIAGDMVGMNVADGLIRAKHGGMTPAEKKYGAQDEAYRQQIIDQFLAENGIG